MNDALRQVMRAAEGSGRLQGAEVATGRAEHPVCGDVVQVDVRWRDGIVLDLAWQACGCPATMAVAAAARAALLRQPRDLVHACLAQRLAALGGLQAHEGHALELFVAAVHATR